MIILPLEFNFAEIGSVTELCERSVGHIFPLPDAEESTILLICMQLHPVVTLVPSHTLLLEIVQEVY